MAKKQNKEKNYSEAELIVLFGLERVPFGKMPLMQEWLHCHTSLQADEETLFYKILEKAQNNIEGWQEEDLKMKFVAFVLALGYLEDTEAYHTYFDATISATVEGHFLKTKTDFMVAKGVLDLPQMPYFHFQEYKKQREPSGDPVAQLLEAFLIAQETNKNGKPMYGCTITGKYWEFFTMEGKTYCISKSYDCTDEQDLLQIIAILRKFKEILETRLLD
jgi:hypothetical protein